MPATLELVEAVPEHVDWLGPRLREGDEREMAAMGLSGWEALMAACTVSQEAHTALVDGEPAAMWGFSVANLLDDRAAVWLLTGYPVLRTVRPLLRAGTAFVTRINARYPILESTGDLSYAGGVALARYLGFVDHEPMKIGGRDFMRMRRLRCA